MKIFRKIKIVLAMLVTGFFSYCQSNQGHEVDFSIKNIQNKQARIGYFYGSEIKYTDTITIDNKGLAKLKGPDKLPEGLYVLQFENTTFDFIISEQRFSIETSFPDPDWKAEINGSKENNIYFNYKKFVIQKKNEKDFLRNSLSNNPGNNQARAQLEEISRQVKNYRDSLFSNFAENLAVKIIKAGIEVKVPIDKPISNRSDSLNYKKTIRSTLFNNIDLTDERLVRTPYVEERILNYLRTSDFHPDSIQKSCDEILSKVKGNKEVYQYTLRLLMHNFEISNKPWMDVLYTFLAEKYYLKEYMNLKIDSTELLNVKANVKRMSGLLTGKIAPPITFLDLSNHEVSLYDVKAKFTIVYFWDPDCDHCRIITPKLNKLYPELRTKGVEVYAINIQQAYQSWQEYISKNQLKWINVWEPTKIQEVYKTYQVGTTPAIYLLDENKRILSKKITLEELEDYLKMLLN